MSRQEIEGQNSYNCIRLKKDWFLGGVISPLDAGGAASCNLGIELLLNHVELHESMVPVYLFLKRGMNLAAVSFPAAPKEATWSGFSCWR